MLSFEWDDAKAAANEAKHGVSFQAAVRAFSDPHGIDVIDETMDYGEIRFSLVAFSSEVLLSVAYTERGEKVRIISARRATRRERVNYDSENPKI